MRIERQFGVRAHIGATLKHSKGTQRPKVTRDVSMCFQTKVSESASGILVSFCKYGMAEAYGQK
jgi:hypothetical protein